jgi:hypothetical protein
LRRKFREFPTVEKLPATHLTHLSASEFVSHFAYRLRSRRAEQTAYLSFPVRVIRPPLAPRY